MPFEAATPQDAVRIVEAVVFASTYYLAPAAAVATAVVIKEVMGKDGKMKKRRVNADGTPLPKKVITHCSACAA